MSCKLCKRAAKDVSGLCRYHSSASTELRNSYVVWNDAYSGMSWKDYLHRVKTAEGTGRWVREVIRMEESVAND